MNDYKVFVTCKHTKDRLNEYCLDDISIDDNKDLNCTITVDTKKRFQKILGFGGAITESSAYVIAIKLIL